MKKLLFILFSMLFFASFLYSQEKQLSVKESHSVKNTSNINPLLDNHGNISGTYEGFFSTDKPLKMQLTFENKTMNIPDPLGMFIVAPQAKRLFNYGNTPGFVVDYYLKLNIFNLSGNLISHKDDIGHAPYAVAVSTNGDFYAASFTDTTYMGLNLRKLDKNGTEEWIVSLAGYNPLNIFISPDSKTIAVVLLNILDMTSELRFFDQKGKLLTSYKTEGSVTGLEFVSSNKFILVENSTWNICELNNEIRILFTGHLAGNPFSTYPVTVNNSSGWFAVVSNTAANQYHLEVINIQDGKLIASANIKETPYWEAYRLLTVEKNNDLVLKTENQVITLEITK